MTITCDKFDALAQKVEEIHRMLKEQQPRVVPLASTSEKMMVLFGSPANIDPWHFPTMASKTTGDTNG